jgi:hypothetical protein
MIKPSFFDDKVNNIRIYLQQQVSYKFRALEDHILK